MTAEWMPVNPCEKCAASPNNDPQAFDGCEVFNTCVQYGVRIGGITAQRKLLEYLIANTDETKGYSHVVTYVELKSMLKQLEEQSESNIKE
jgi:hypothetical protein